MNSLPLSTKPQRTSYDVVIVGGAIMGSSVAWHLSHNQEFTGSILVVERDPTYEWSSTARTNSCVRQQFSNELNVRLSQYAIEVIKNFRASLGGEPEVPDIALNSFGYLYLAHSEDLSEILCENQKVQAACGAGTRILSPEEIAAAYPFYYLDDIVLGSHNLKDEGYFDGSTMFDWWRRKARRQGVEYVTNEVVSMECTETQVTEVRLRSGESIAPGYVVNAAGTRAALISRMAGLTLPVEPRKRHSYLFAAETPLDRPLPLTIDPSGVHVRSEGQYYLCGCPPDEDLGVEFDDFAMDPLQWEEKVWPALAHRIPSFEAIKLIHSWAGHYAFNTLDQNAVVGAHDRIRNFIFVNGFSGHGLQQSPAIGRGVAETITYGEYRTLDLSPLGYHRVIRNTPFRERAII